MNFNIFNKSEKFSERAASNVELSLLALTLFCLPLYEAPKNIFSILFLLVWAFQSWKSKSLGGSSPFDLPILVLALVLWVSPFFSGFSSFVSPLDSAPRWSLLALFVLSSSRLNYTERQLMVIWGALMMGGIYAVIDSFYQWDPDYKNYPEFRSVGHVNHSSMYSLIPLAAGLGALKMRDYWFKCLGLLSIFSTIVFLPASRSIVGLVSVLFIVTFSFIIIFLRGRSWIYKINFVFLFLFSVSFLFLLPQFADLRDEIRSDILSGDIFSGRLGILNSALAVWDKHPFIGTGWNSFGVATSREVVQHALNDSGIAYSAGRYQHAPHGHNLFVNILIERGLVGVVMVATLLLLYFKTFLPIAWRLGEIDRTDVGSALSVVLVALGFAVAGLGNTTMMNEHGHAGMAFISVAYGYLRGRGLLPYKPD
ncbi:O-antigen ligase family protein [Roseobacter sp. HKCCD5988]|uniref:O-antigen ligase family protein n=1 Tax=Roseobacter sp. HKCCD5988 TaxID=3120338 RepID=UPI0030ECF50B